MADLKQLPITVKRKADSFLKKNGLLDYLKRYGDVRIRGSYELDLMVDGDIDIYVIDSKLNKDKVIDCLNGLIKENKFRGYFFYDFVKRRKKGFPKGYYIGIKTKVGGERWKADIWFMKSLDNSSDRFMKKIKSGLNDNNRGIILKLKKAVKEGKMDISSSVIYEAVLFAKVDSLKKLVSFISNQGLI